jgi:galactokinase
MSTPIKSVSEVGLIPGLAQRFADRFGCLPSIYRAPGRVNLIGEHTDYNDGFVMPAAIGFRTQVAIAPRNDRCLVIHSENYSERIEFDLDLLPADRAGHWSDYVIGVVTMLRRSGKAIPAANLLIEGNVPLGAGLSSSASVEVAVACALLDLAGEAIDPTNLALLCQKAENDFVGARCGIMDQFIATHARSGQALMLDCRSLEYRMLPIPEGVALVICNTMVKHSIAKGEYNQRRAECEEGVRLLATFLPHVRALRDVTIENLEKHGHELREVVERRCRHVVTENDRVLRAAEALNLGDLQRFGNLMLKSHRSLRDDFEVSCSELDCMVAIGEELRGVYGMRMTGGGFGGCTIALVQNVHVAEFERAMIEGYEESTNRKPEIYVCSTADGASKVV